MTSKSVDYAYSALFVASPRPSQRASSSRTESSFSLSGDDINHVQPESKVRSAYLNKSIIYLWLQTHRQRIFDVARRFVIYMILLAAMFVLHRYGRAQKKTFTLAQQHLNQSISHSHRSTSSVFWPIMPMSHRAVKALNVFAYDDLDAGSDQSTLPSLSRQVLMLDPHSIDDRERRYTNSRLIVISIPPRKCVIQSRNTARTRLRYVQIAANLSSTPFKRHCRDDSLCLISMINKTASQSDVFMFNSFIDFGYHSDSSLFIRSIIQYYHALPPFVAFVGHRLADRNEAISRLALFLSNNAFQTGEERSKQTAFLNLLPGEYECHEVHFNSSSVSKHDHVEVTKGNRVRDHIFNTLSVSFNESLRTNSSTSHPNDSGDGDDDGDNDDDNPLEQNNENVNIDAIILAARFLNTSIPARICSDRSDAFLVSRSALLAFPKSFYQQLMKSCEVSDPALRSATCLVDLLWPHLFTVMNNPIPQSRSAEVAFSLTTSTFSFHHTPLLDTTDECAMFEHKHLLHQVQRVNLLNRTELDIAPWPTNPPVSSCKLAII